MTIDNITCVYHNENVKATHKCERCKATVCLLHIERVKTRRYHQADEIYEFCIDCANESRQINERLQNKSAELMKMLGTANSMQKFFFVFFLVFFLLINFSEI